MAEILVVCHDLSPRYFLMVGVLLKTCRTMAQPYFLTMLVLSLTVTILTFGLFVIVVGYLLSVTTFVSTGWIDVILDWTAGFGTVIVAWFLFPALLPLVASVFSEQIAGRIERREYDLAPPASLALGPGVMAGLKFAGLSLALNLLVLPLYLLPGLFPFIYYGLNSYLLGVECFETVAGRHAGRKAATALRRQHRMPVLLSGLIIALGATFPFAGLFAPFISVALMVHLHQYVRSSPWRGA